MPKLPFPPSADVLRGIGPEEIVLPAGTHLARIYFSGGEYPAQWNQFRYWGPTTSRFDHHMENSDGEAHLQDRGIMYAAGHDKFGALATCLAEVFQDRRRVDCSRNEPFFVVFKIKRDLRLLNLKSLWPTRAGASAVISTGPKKTARLWSQTIYEAYPDLDGILYGCAFWRIRPPILTHPPTPLVCCEAFGFCYHFRASWSLIFAVVFRMDSPSSSSR